MMRKLLMIILILLLSHTMLITEVKANVGSVIMVNDDEVIESYDYQEDDEDISFEEYEENIEELDEKIESKNSLGVVLVEIFCGLIGIIMVVIAFKANEK